MNFSPTANGVATTGNPTQFPTTSSYTRIEVDVEGPAGTDGLSIQLSNPGGSVGSCFLVDDVSIARLKP